MEKWIEVVGLALFVNWLLHWFTPIQPLRERLVDKMVRMMVKINAYRLEPLLLVFTCVKCLSFWSALIYFQNLTLALICSFLAITFETVIKYKNNNVE